MPFIFIIWTLKTWKNTQCYQKETGQKTEQRYNLSQTSLFIQALLSLVDIYLTPIICQPLYQPLGTQW